jgi:hypothetical protein
MIAKSKYVRASWVGGLYRLTIVLRPKDFGGFSKRVVRRF